MTSYLGLGKTKFNSSVCLVSDNSIENCQLVLTERLTRKKASGAWPIEGIKNLSKYFQNTVLEIAENRDVHLPSTIEDIYDQKFSFYDFLRKNHLEKFCSKFNKELKFITHHEAHAYAALAMSPFEKAIILVLDGAGTNSVDFSNSFQDIQKDSFEECSVYLQDKGVISLVNKRWTQFDQSFAPSIGALYEKISEYIFNSSTSSGKVMGLAPLGDATEIADRLSYQKNLDWNKSFNGSNKREWEQSTSFSDYCNIAASVQKNFEEEYSSILKQIKCNFPDYRNLILAGGCAMNCTNNAKILKTQLFDQIYVPPFPGDESISFGLAQCLRLKDAPNKWKPFDFENQSAYLGPVSSIPTDSAVEEELKRNEINFEYSKEIASLAVKDLIDGKIIGWFQGRSESGPRALGNRSILARADKPGLKHELNQKIKFRESFRPYGCSTIFEKAHEYFEVEKDFNNPYMSFAISVRDEFKDVLKEVSHIDQTSRMQIVRPGQNKLFYELIKSFGDETGLYCLLNTSLNIMGEPIVETIADAINLFKVTPIDILYIGNFKIARQIDQAAS